MRSPLRAPMRPQMIQSGLIPWGHWRWVIPVDTLTGVMVIAVCIGILAANVGTVIDKAQMSGVWFQTQPARIAVSEALALTGDIDASIPAGSTPDTVGGRWQVDDRGASVRLSGHHVQTHSPYTLSMRLAVNAAEPAGSVFWICGAHTPPRGWSTGATTGPIDVQDAPNWLAPCRAAAGS